MVERIFSMGRKFNQRLKTVHIAIELIDRFFLDSKTQLKYSTMDAQTQSNILVTCFLIASKYDEIDDQLVFINDV